jgi:hypothetical protein
MEESHQTSAVTREPLRGQHIFVRRLAASDRDGYAALFSRLSPESRYRRFLGPKLRLSDEELAYFTEIDHVRREALALEGTRPARA